MASRRPDVLEYPTGLTVLRTFQALLSVIVIVVVAFTVPILIFPGNIIMIITGSATLLVSLWMIMAHASYTHLYNFWAGVVLDIVLFVLWIISIGVIAGQTSFLWTGSSDYCDRHDCPDGLSGIASFYGYIFAAACGLGVIQVLFSTIFLIFHGVMTRRQRRYNRVGHNIDAEPVERYSVHPQGPIETQPLKAETRFS